MSCKSSGLDIYVRSRLRITTLPEPPRDNLFALRQRRLLLPLVVDRQARLADEEAKKADMPTEADYLAALRAEHGDAQDASLLPEGANDAQQNAGQEAGEVHQDNASDGGETSDEFLEVYEEEDDIIFELELIGGDDDGLPSALDGTPSNRIGGKHKTGEDIPALIASGYWISPEWETKTCIGYCPEGNVIPRDKMVYTVYSVKYPSGQESTEISQADESEHLDTQPVVSTSASAVAVSQEREKRISVHNYCYDCRRERVSTLLTVLNFS